MSEYAKLVKDLCQLAHRRGDHILFCEFENNTKAATAPVTISSEGKTLYENCQDIKKIFSSAPLKMYGGINIVYSLK